MTRKRYRRPKRWRDGETVADAAERERRVESLRAWYQSMGVCGPARRLRGERKAG